MKKILYVLSALMVVACSSPKYTASFNQYDPQVNYHPLKKVTMESQSKSVSPEEVQVPVLASATNTPTEIKSEKPVEVRKTYVQMNKVERKALRNQLRSDIKTYVKAQKANLGLESVSATKALDNDLKLAAIFGAVGIVALIIGGDVFWIIGGVAMIIGVVFFVKWLVRQ
jgi:predicted component of type VI protein secretion system